MLATQMPDINSTMAMMAAASFFNDLVMPHAWASCMDVGGRYAASVSGTMNLMGNLAGASSTMIGGFLLSQAGGDWNQFITDPGGGLFPWGAVLGADRSAHADRRGRGAPFGSGAALASRAPFGSRASSQRAPSAQERTAARPSRPSHRSRTPAPQEPCCGKSCSELEPASDRPTRHGPSSPS